MGAFKNDTQRGGPRGFGTQGMDSASGDTELELDRVDNPQQPRKAFSNKYQATYGIGEYASADMGQDPIARPKTDTGNRNREADIWAADGGGPAEGLAQKLPKPAGAPKGKRMTTALGDY
jgi:hypothetical protein